MTLKGTRIAAALGVATLLTVGGAPAANAACEYHHNLKASRNAIVTGEAGYRLGCSAAHLLGNRKVCGEYYRDSATGKFCIPEDLKPKKEEKEEEASEEESDQQEKPSLGGGGGGSRGGGSRGGGIWFFPGSSFGYSGTVTVGPAETVQE